MPQRALPSCDACADRGLVLRLQMQNRFHGACATTSHESRRPENRTANPLAPHRHVIPCLEPRRQFESTLHYWLAESFPRRPPVALWRQLLRRAQRSELSSDKGAHVTHLRWDSCGVTHPGHSGWW